jgi:hypothetical protein
MILKQLTQSVRTAIVKPRKGKIRRKTMSDNPLDIFKGGDLATKHADLFDELMEETKALAGSGDYRRISIRGKRFRQLIGGDEQHSTAEPLNVVVVKSAPIARFYYKDAYDRDHAVAPTCWSTDTERPAEDVPKEQRQASRCMDCKMNAKGSGQGDTRACRFSQRHAVVLEGALEDVYQLQLPATSIFGKPDNGKMPMQAYAKYLNQNKVPAAGVVTQMYFDDDSDTPKLFFKALRMVGEEELDTIVELRGSDAVERALDLSVAQTDTAVPEAAAEEVADEVRKKDKKDKKKKDKKKDAAPSVDEVDEPEKVEEKKKPEPVDDGDDSSIDALLSEWGDD